MVLSIIELRQHKVLNNIHLHSFYNVGIDTVIV